MPFFDAPEPVFSRRRVIVAIAAAGLAGVSLLADSDTRLDALIYGVGATVTLWWPYLWVWAVARREFSKPAPLGYVYVFGWAAMGYAYFVAIHGAFNPAA